MAIALTPGPQAAARESVPGHGALAGATFTAACVAAFLGFVPAFGAGRDEGLVTPVLAHALPLAGLLLGLTSEAACFAINGLSFLALIAGLLFIEGGEPPRASGSTRGPGSSPQ